MECLSCGRLLAEPFELVSYADTDTTLHLILKPEVVPAIKTLETVSASSKVKVVCVGCKADVGKNVPIGPNRLGVFAISLAQVRLFGQAFGKKAKWKSLTTYHSRVELRTIKKFNTITPVMPSSCVRPKALESTRVAVADRSKLDDFRWDDILDYKIPRDYQQRAYIEALLSDLILVLPTGTGKTLVSSMVLGRMKTLNPTKIGVFVVHRIPLVFQQAAALRQDTGLSVIGLCSENITEYKVEQIQKHRYDILVITAGCFMVLLRQKQNLSLNQFHTLVMDECHNASGGHKYSDVLSEISKLPVHDRPRFLGLTASPVDPKSIVSCHGRLEKFLSSFPSSTRLLRLNPDLASGNVEENWIKFSSSNAQQAFAHTLLDKFKERCKKFPFPSVCIESVEALTTNLGSVRGTLTSMDAESIHRDELNTLVTIVNAFEVSNIFGPSVAISRFPLLKEILAADQLSNDHTSTRLKLLEKELDAVYESEQRAQKRILVFVQTRHCARILQSHLSNKYPDFRPMHIVGRGGMFGMSWHGCQQDVIEAFNKGASNLLVATSVVEEGLDIQSCDLVITFSQTLNLIRMIQSRGRARKSKSKFLILLDQHEHEIQSEIKKREDLMNIVFGSSYQTSPLTEEIFSRLSADPEIIQKVELRQEYLKTAWSGPEDISFTVFIEGPERADEEDGLIKAITSVSNMEVTRIIPVEKSIYLTGTLFSSSCRAFLVGLKCEGFGRQRAGSMYFQLCKMLKFFSSSKFFQNCFLGFKEHAMFVPRPQAFPSQPSTFHGFKNIAKISLGTFVDRQTIFEFPTSILNVNHLKASRSVLKIQGDHEFKIMLPCVGPAGFAFGTSVSPSGFKICIPLSPFPIIYQTIAERDLRILFWPSDSTLDLNDVDLLILHVERGSIESSVEFEEVRNFLFSPDVLPLSLIDAHFKFPSDLPTQNHQQLAALKGSERFEILWKIGVLKSSRKIIVPKNLDQGLEVIIGRGIDPSVVARSLDFLHTVPLGFVSDVMDVLNRTITDVAKFSDRLNEIFSDPAPPDFVSMKSVAVTPARIIFHQEMKVRSSRLLRKFKDETFLTVSLRDESLLKTEDPSAIEFLVQKIFVNGLEICGERFHFLSASGSQLREHNAIFVKGDSPSHAVHLRDQIVLNKEDFKSIWKYFSRVGLFSTADTNMGFVSHKRLGRIRDIEARNKTLLTDGAGIIRRSYADDTLKLRAESDVVQFRFNGAKGILLKVDDTDIVNNFDLVLRDSNIKFVSDSYEFGRVTENGPKGAVNLNREVINLMTSINSSIKLENYILFLQQRAVGACAERLANITEAETALRASISGAKILDVLQSFFILDHAWWLRILILTYYLDLKNIKDKANIPVEKGRRFFGAPDPKGILNENEIFCQVQDVDGSPFVIEGQVLLYRNPCLHPGDLRVVKAVNKSELKRYKNVILFPTKSSCSSSLADQCSGGDLDGDEFSIIWDPRLVPSFTYPPLDYTSLAQNAPINYDNVNSQERAASVFESNMKNDALGRVAHLHMALSDMLDKGACDPVAIELAKSQSIAVDYPKTGIVPKVPVKAVEMVSKLGYPDFMEKAVGESYMSTKLLGKLYRQVKDLLLDNTDIDFVLQELSPHPLLVLNGHERFLLEAREAFKLYCYDLSYILSRFGLKREEELFAGRALRWHPLLKSDKGRASEMMTATANELVEKYRRFFFRNLESRGTQDKYLKASAWYVVSFDKFLSFGWIMKDLLCEISQIQNNIARKIFVLEKSIGGSVLQHFKESHVPMVQAKFLSVRESLVKIETSFPLNGLKAHLYGSMSMFLCNESSDMDICALDDKERDEMILLEQVVLPLIDRLAISVTLPNRSMNHPFLRCTLPAGEGSICCDITSNKLGFAKTLFMHKLYKEKPSFLPVMAFLVDWGRNEGILKSTQEDSSVISTAEFYAFILLMLDNEVPQVSVKKSDLNSSENHLQDFDALANEIDTANEEVYIASLILHFFRRASALLPVSMTYTWPITGIRSTDNKDLKIFFSASTIQVFTESSRITLHKLCLTRSAKAVLFECGRDDSMVPLVKVLPVGVSKEIEDAASFHCERMKLLTNVLDVSLVRMAGSSNLQLTASGNKKSIECLKTYLRRLCQSHRSFIEGKPRLMGSRYFIRGSELLLNALGATEDEVLSFSEYFGDFYIQHARMPLYSLSLPVAALDEITKALEGNIQLLGDKIRTQLRKFPRHKKKLLETLEVSVGFGQIYCCDRGQLIRAGSFTLKELESSLESSRSRKFAREESPRVMANESDSSNRDDIELQELPKGFSKPKIEEDILPTISKVKSKKKEHSIQGSFMPGVCQRLLSYTEGFEPQLVEDMLLKTITVAGFRPVSTTSDCCVSWKSIYKWRISSQVMKSVEVCLDLDENQKVTRLSERELNWVHSTLINFGQNSKPFDVRINIQSRETSDELKKLVFSEKNHSKSSFIEFDQRTKRPVLTQALSEKMRKHAHHMRCLERYHLFTNGKCDAKILNGIMFEGEGFRVQKPFCILSLQFPNSELVEFVQNPSCSGSECLAFSEKLMKDVYAVAETLDRQLKQNMKHIQT